MKNKIFLITVSLILGFSTFYGQNYKRIVSLAPSSTQSLYFLEAQDLLVGCTSYCMAAKADRKEIVSSAVKPNIEKLISLKPDLVLGSGLTNPKDVATLEKLGIKVKIIPSPKSFVDICRQFIELGTLIGKKQKAIDITRESIRKVKQVSQQMKWKSTPNMFFQIGADPIFTVLDNTFMNDYITLLKGKNIASGLDKGTLAREFVLGKNPEFIFIATMGIVGEEEKSTWEKYSQLKASKAKAIYIVSSDIACQPTPVTFAQTMEILGSLILKK